MDKLVRFCREVATFGLTVALIAMLLALIWGGTLAGVAHLLLELVLPLLLLVSQ